MQISFAYKPMHESHDTLEQFTQVWDAPGLLQNPHRDPPMLIRSVLPPFGVVKAIDLLANSFVDMRGFSTIWGWGWG